MRGLQGKRLVIAGGATGIGAATAERLAAEGTEVVIGDVNLEPAWPDRPRPRHPPRRRTRLDRQPGPYTPHLLPAPSCHPKCTPQANIWACARIGTVFRRPQTEV
ncbi:uncharacterized protein SAZU_0491 [Streptomyces azureus]|uniref:Short-chain dehydrogenase/reductase SDR n=1 Tax=Streptomyces azureus TaxID=146537 RepID=A0A0K8PCY5_STRAJ|nr:uncharacterized protein SAZU_0491 [Streptomyces azureus]